MPANRHTFSNCGHKGWGGYCHRCKEADKLEAKSKQKGVAKEEVEKLKAEVDRLRGRQYTKAERRALPRAAAPAVEAPTEAEVTA